MDKDAKIYIAGHRGLVGSAIWRAFEDDGYTSLIGRTREDLDLTNQVAVEEFFATEKPEYVVLAAAKVGGVNANNIYRADFIYDNLQIQNNIIGSSYKHKVKKLLFLGSSCIYPKLAPQPMTEDVLLTSDLEYTNEPYAIAKIAGIKMIESFNIQYGTNYLSVMPTNLYGVNDNFDLEKSHVMPALIRKTILAKYLEDGKPELAAKNLGVAFESEDQVLDLIRQYGVEKQNGQVVLRLWGTGKPYREFLHVDDMAKACVFVLENVDFKDLTEGMEEIKNTHINVGYDSDVTITQLAEKIKDIVGYTGDIRFDLSDLDGTPRKLMSSAKLHNLGWQHTIDLDEGLRRTIAWYQEQQA